MAICQDCGQEMLQAPTCNARPDMPMIHGGELFGPIGYGGERPINVHLADRCGDCGVVVGGFHHFGCDMEQCPRCGRQLITCDCGPVFELSMLAS
jgi:hypothetical protein